MPLDAICLSAVARELSQAAVGGRIDKIYQPSRDEVILQVRGSEGSCRLLLSAHPNRARAQLTDLQRENPAEPPMFCMLLRKYLSGGRILGIWQPPFERLLEFRIEATDEMGDRGVRRLILEAMGRHSNLILLDGEGRIVDCLRRVDGDMSGQRQILPGLFYRLPPSQGKLDPSELTPERKAQLLAELPADRPADRWLMDTFSGFSPLIARELAFEAFGSTDAPVGNDPEQLLFCLERLTEQTQKGAGEPYMLIREGKPTDFSFRPILQYGAGVELKQLESFAALMDSFYETRETVERVRQKGQDLIRSVTTARDRTARKLGIQRKECLETQDRDRLRELGDILTANLHQMKKGWSVFQTVDFYNPEGKEIEIRLNPLRTPQENAARYYKDYNRAKTAERMLTEQIAKGEQELDYLNSVLESLERAQGERDLLEIRQEMIEGGYIRKNKKEKSRMKRPAAKLLEFQSSAGLRISVGRNNTQNDLLTTKLAGRGDLWFHTQKIHGAHVILWTVGEPDVQSMSEAALLAAWFSQGRNGTKIPVDYTQVRYVKKPAGAKPGMVIYQTYETTYVTPDEHLVKAILATGGGC